MRVGVTGATGFVGKALLQALRDRGDAVVAWTRDPARARSTLAAGVEVAGLDDLTPAALGALDAVVNLAGEPVAGRRWDDAQKARIRASRVDTTRRVVDALAGAAPTRPRVLVNASAVGYYGPRGDEVVDEATPAGEAFLASVCRDWEAEAVRAEGLGVRVVRLRIGVVLGAGGGPLAEMVKPFQLFAGGTIGSGRQYLPWVHLDDVVGLVLFALDHDAVRGAVNATAPEPVRAGAFATTLGRVMGRPAWLPVPGFMLRAAVGEMATVLLTGQRAVPRAALAAGYAFRHRDLAEALRVALDGSGEGRR